MRPIQLIKGFLTVGLWTFLSRILGFVRDILIAARLGDGPVGEAFFVALTLPNMFRRFFAEGALNMAFVPLFSKKLGNEADARTFAQDAFSGLATVLIVFTVIAQVAMPWLVLALASGFLGDARFEMATDFGRVIFPYILLISLAALLSGILNATGRFAAAAAAPVLLNITLVSAMLLAEPMGWNFGWALSWAVPIAGVAQLALLWRAAAKAGFSLTPRWPRLTPDLKRLAIIAAPAMLAGGVVQINLIVGKQVASRFEGAITYLNLADRLYQLPLGVVAIAIGVVLLPDLSRRLAENDTVGGRAALNRATEFALLLTVPAAVALVVIAKPIVSVLYQRGAFDAEAAAATATVTAIYGAGLPAFVLQKVLQPLYFARHDTKSPFRFALIAMVINGAVAFGFYNVIGFTAAAWATTIAGWSMVWLLWRGSRDMGEAAQPDARLTSRIWRIALASAVMACILAGLAWLMGPALYTPSIRYAALAALITAGVVTYGIAGQVLGAFRLSELRAAVRRNRDTPPVSDTSGSA